MVIASVISMFLMWFTSKAQLLFVFILLGLYSWNSFAANLVIENDKKSFSYSSGQLELLSERLQNIEGDEFQTEIGSALLEISAKIKKNDLKVNLDSLFTKAGNTPLPFSRKYYKYQGNNFVFYKNYFEKPHHVDFKLAFLNYYFSHYEEFNYGHRLSSSILEYEQMTLKKLNELILNDLHLAINDYVNELLDRNGEYGQNKINISMNTIKRTFGLSKSDEHISLAQFLDPYLFQMQRHLLKKEKLHENIHFKNLRALIGEFSNDQFFAIVFKKDNGDQLLNLKHVFIALNEKINEEFPNFRENILRPRIISEELEKSVVDYIKTPNNLIESNQMITAMLCGLNENIKSQAFAKNNIVVNYCHYNSLYSAFLLSNRSKSTNKALVNYPKISTLQKIERSVSSEKLNQL